MRNSNNRYHRGSSIVEFSIGLLVFLVFAGGLSESGRFPWIGTTLHYAVQQGLRYALANGNGSAAPATNDDIRSRVLEKSPGIDSGSLLATTNRPPDNGAGSAVTVEADSTVGLILGSLVGSKGLFKIQAASNGIIQN